MSVVLLDPRFPAMIPVEAVTLLSGDVSYTEEVPVRIRWVIADLGGHTVDTSDVLVTTDLQNPEVQTQLQGGEDLISAPSLLVEMEPQRQLESSEAPRQSGMPSESAIKGDFSNPQKVEISGGQIVDGEIVGTDEHTVAVAGLRRTTRTEVPASVMDEIEDAVALMARALRQGEWEQEMTHQSLLPYLRQETEELAEVVSAMEKLADSDTPKWMEQELCKELADVLLQVLFHAEIANRRGSFDIGHVAGAFVVKLQSRAPYLFESVERVVPKNEQDRLWAEGKERERAERKKTLGEDYAKLVAMKDNAGQAAEEPQRAASTASQPVQTAAVTDPAPTQAPSSVPAATSNPAPAQQTSTSGLHEAELVIAEARELGLKDSEIPMDIRYPMVGLEMDKPGEADRRLRDAVTAFRTKIRQQQPQK
ncbi:MazG nucleotide pyrophosphohydrolase domain-containing protein [uncultured Corynebacterium sp.]|uniref:MazG nucleotide pyrophosphohydrolase domain-containing protein n=1 Tax=uncultured Corynebacterium sp. TaxID=159447 RepID=UPI0025926663|nr:MazG nucleotide pyrophosphohydrolase domain-containing protein [uncultured Corynebacterium sp.]